MPLGRVHARYRDAMENSPEWDASLFGGAAQFYERGRLPYAPGLPNAFRDALRADGTGRLLDVGCGPGSITLRLAGAYAEVVGIDPDPGMLREAERLRDKRRITNATFIRAPAEDLPLGLGDFDTITFASSFHWMDRERAARTVQSMLRAGGAVVQIDTVRRDGESPAGQYPPPPRKQIGELVRQYLGEQRRAGQKVGFVYPTNEEDVWRAAGFSGPELVRIPDNRVLTRSIDDVIAGTLSMSSSAPHLFGERLPDFRNDLRELLHAASVSGNFSVALTDNELRIWRP